MSTKSIYLIVFAMVISVAASSAMAELIAYYPFREGQGTTTADVTGNGNDGTFNGNVEWVSGYRGMGVRFDTAGERIVIGPIDPTAGTDAMTLAAWVNWQGSGGGGHQGIVGKRLGWTTDGATIKWFWQTTNNGDLLFRADYSGGGQSMGWGNGALASYANEWTHVAVTWENEVTLQYINGVQVSSGNIALREAANATPVTIGCVDSTNDETFVGIIDEVQIHNAALTAEEIVRSMDLETGFGPASDPRPADGAIDVRRDTALHWAPGDYAVTHNVYFGTDANTVAAADTADPMGVLISEGQTATTYQPADLLDFGQTYYWRVDEVNAPPDSTVYTGNVWSFTVEPVLYPVQDVVASASIPTAFGSGGPEVTVDNSGLIDGQHSISDADMWSGSDVEGETPWLQYDLGGVYKLFGIHVWNYNGAYEYILGLGLKDITIEYAVEPNEWMTLGDYELARATNAPTYTGQRLDLDGITAGAIRIHVHSTQGGGPRPGLSEIQFFYKPLVAREPEPASGTIDLDPDITLSWRPGREAVSHQVHFGTDEQAVIDGVALVDTVAETTFDPGALNLGTDYFWRIDEVNEAAVPSVWAGPVWNFTTKEFIGIEGFESYTDDPGNEIFEFWADGFEVSNNGSVVGHDLPPYAERRIVHSGSQSMPFYYDNTSGVVNSEAVRTFASPQNWAANGADTLSLYYRGVPTAFIETASGSILMNGTGEDIYNTVDQFRFAYKQLTGNGSITVRIDRIDRTHDYAKAGVMIRSGLGTVPLQAHMAVTPSGRTEWQYRPVASGDTTQVDTGADTTPVPYWVRLTRQGNTITGERSTDGETWLPLTADDPASSRVDLVLAEPVYIGLVVTSHVAGTPAGAEFSNVSTTGTVSAGWQLAAVGADQVPGNGADAFYVAVEDSSGNKKTVFHPSPAAVGTGVWTPWRIELSEFTSAGVDMAHVKKFYIGVGDKTLPSRNASGVIYIDDLAFGRQRQ